MCIGELFSPFLLSSPCAASTAAASSQSYPPHRRRRVNKQNRNSGRSGYEESSTNTPSILYKTSSGSRSASTPACLPAPLTLARLCRPVQPRGDQAHKSGSFRRRDPANMFLWIPLGPRREPGSGALGLQEGNTGQPRRIPARPMYFRHDATQRAGTTPTAISPLSLRPRLHRKMALEQRAIFPLMLTASTAAQNTTSAAAATRGAAGALSR